MRRAERIDAVTLLALLAAAPLGLIAATPVRSYLLAAVGGAAFVGVVWTYAQRDPAMVLAGLWLFQPVRTPLAATLSGLPGAGALIDQLTDVATLVLVASLIVNLLGRDTPRRDLRFLVPAIGVALFGVLSSMLQHAPLGPSVSGLWLGTKLWVLVGLAVAVPWQRRDVERVFGLILRAGAVVALLGLLDFALHGAVASALHSDLEVTKLGTYRSRAAQAVYATPNEYCLAMSLLVALAVARAAVRRRGRDLALVVLLVAAAVVSLRLKAVLSIAVVFALVPAVLALRGERGGATTLIAGALCLAAIVTFEGDIIARQVSAYGASQTSARSELYRAGFRIARDHFPLGVGFGRFGSAPSRLHYSEVYDDYGLSQIWGLSREFPRFISDTSWPSVLGETGVAGLLVYAAGLLALGLMALRRLRVAVDADLFAPLALLAVLAVLLVDSTGDSTLFSWNTIATLALVVAATRAMDEPAAQPASQRL